MFTLIKLVSVLAAIALSATAASSCHQQANTIGSDHALDLVAAKNEPFSYIIEEVGATYIAPHFNELSIPDGGVLEISALDGSQKVRYTGARSDFYAEYVTGPSAVLTYYPPQDIVISVDIFSDDNSTESTTGGLDAASVAFSVDRFASGFATGIESSIEAICGADNSKAAVCLKSSDATKYTKAQAVGRLLIGGSSLCTGWLFGSQGHLITNNHCIGTAAAAAKVQFEFGAECATCSDPNNLKQLACPGTTVATSAQFIYTNKELDVTLVKLNLKAGVSLAKYGYLQARTSGPVLNEPIYIAQHPGGKPKRLATIVDSGAVGTIEKFSIASCSPDEIGYSLDTEGGSSGSPVLSTKDNLVVGLHNCGGCQNGATKINKVVAQLKGLGLLPANAAVARKLP
ncbi:hypothetical protein DYB38_008466 [Aphanomyces astaci]|uniref:Serine protease n=1 Tax=Aphanomyces astaci TaxID=112090 RepID=A0A397D7H0_APHAT|nr:hypothetical protein DYB38_008466 [Aphanomyces astaci]